MVFGQGPRGPSGGLTSKQVREQASRSPGGQLWVDPEFKEDGALYRRASAGGGAPKITFNGGRPIQWLRPHELKGASPGDIELVKDGVSSGDVIQGELGDCYLLGAMSSIAAATHRGVPGALLKRLIKTGSAELALGFVTFEMYSFGEWVETTVDTLLPCDESGAPLFAHCKDTGEMWVPLLEKAYAKLYGSYEALDGGNVTAAIVDLSGGVGERIDLLDEDTVVEISDGSLWQRLLRYQTKENYMLACALVRDEVVDRGTKADPHATDLGILVNHAYTLLDVREVGEPYKDSSKARLLKLRNPWGDGEWKGPWSDNDGMWRTPLGARALRTLGVTFDDDGTFWLSWEDFQAHFNKVYVVRVVDSVDGTAAGAAQRATADQWFRYELEGEWTEQTAGGCFNFPSWRVNPQFALQTAETTHAYFLLMQPDPKMCGSADRGGDEGGPKYEMKIGMYVMKGKAGMMRKVLYDSEEIEGDDVVDSTPYMAYREVQANTMDEEGEDALPPHTPLVLCPSTFAPGKTGRFRVVVMTERPLAAPPTPLAPLRDLRVRGEWREGNAGGCRNFVSWRQNEQYMLRLNRARRASVVLEREDPQTQRSDVALHSKRKKAKSAASKMGRNRAAELLQGFVVARAHGPHAERRALRIDEDDVVERTQYTLNYEVSREFISEAGGAFVIVPTTFEPSQPGEYELHVYTDDPDAQLSPLPATTWQARGPIKGEWRGRGSGGCRNYPSWVLNPIYQIKASRECELQVFLRQRLPGGGALPEEAEPEGIGFYVMRDDGELSLEDIVTQGGFVRAEEVHGALRLPADQPHLLMPAPYRKGAHLEFDLQLYSAQPIDVRALGAPEADARRRHAVEQEAALVITHALARKQVWRQVRKGTAESRQLAKEMMKEWFSQPQRDNDEGYADINLALNALESAFIQLTGKAEAKGQFFPQMRKRIAARGHKVADYEVCL